MAPMAPRFCMLCESAIHTSRKQIPSVNAADTLNPCWTMNRYAIRRAVTSDWIVSYWSGREDSNLRPHGPE